MIMLYVICAVLWIATLVSLFRRRDIERGERICWIVTVLVLNVIGVLMYFLFGPRRASAPASGEDEIDPDAEPVLSGETSWNPIQGENRFPAGQGLNPKAEGRVDSDTDDTLSATGDGKPSSPDIAGQADPGASSPDHTATPGSS